MFVLSIGVCFEFGMLLVFGIRISLMSSDLNLILSFQRTSPCPDSITQEKVITSAVNQLRSEHVALNSYLHRIGARGCPLCDECNQIKSVRHLLSHCRRYKAQRKRMKTDVNFRAEEESQQGECVRGQSPPEMVSTHAPLGACGPIRDGCFG
ncbi:hypothetical protein O181_008458 [Austropuccinia psidii MF-1]|uniref:Uncharacterized protein n=1 Tax=Austropuccinia psidii MF-1 TaxID=1389203 RepID=A0A9Q3GII6_9BASI|nr:hypothetical protein [Austropuccinia psidii MF-1]